MTRFFAAAHGLRFPSASVTAPELAHSLARERAKFCGVAEVLELGAGGLRVVETVHPDGSVQPWLPLSISPR